MKLSKRKRARKRKRGMVIAAGAAALEAVFLRRRTGSLFGVKTIVRCHSGHLFTTTWIPGASVKALRLGPWRIQRCPVGKHWSVVRPVKPEKLSDGERADARSVRDTLLP
jgi:hypothetical protein